MIFKRLLVVKFLKNWGWFLTEKFSDNFLNLYDKFWKYEVGLSYEIKEVRWDAFKWKMMR